MISTDKSRARKSSAPLCWQRKHHVTFPPDERVDFQALKNKLFKNPKLQLIKDGRALAGIQAKNYPHKVRNLK